MLDFRFSIPTNLVFGRGVEEQAGKLTAEYGKKVMLHYGGQSARKSGLLDRVKASLEAEGLEVLELGGVRPNPHTDLVYEGIELCRNNGIDFILAVGGGSVIDSAKAISMGTAYEGDFWDLFTGKFLPPDAAPIPIGVVLTIPASGSECGAGTVITNEKLGLKRFTGHGGVRPKFALMNPELTYTLPPYQTACGAVDIMAHTLERYLTTTTGVELTDRFAEAILLTIIKEMPKVLADPEDYDARANIMLAGTFAHNDLAGMGRVQDWSSHQMGHELSAKYDTAHGATLSVVIPAYMRYIYKSHVERFAQLAVRVFGVEADCFDLQATALEGIDRLESFFRSIGMPTSFAEIGAREENIDYLAETLLMNNGDRLGCMGPLDRQQVREVYRMMVK